MGSVNYTVLSDTGNSEVKHSFPDSSVLNYTSGALPNCCPLLTDKWLVNIKAPSSLDRCQKFLYKVKSAQDFCVYVFSCTSEEVASFLERNLNCKRLDRRIKSSDDLYNYVMSKLNISKSASLRLIQLCKRYSPRVISSVDTLARLGDGVRITSKMVERYIPDRGASFEDIYKSIAYKVESKVPTSLVLKQIASYSGAPTVLWNYLQKRFEQDISVLSGDKEADLSVYPSYQVDYVLRLSNYLSIETLYYGKAMILTCKKLGTTTGYLKFITEVQRLWR